MRQAAVPGIEPGERRGLPIGNLTSQFWANVYLDPLDHLAARLPGVRGYLRYMDDLLLLADDKPALWSAKRSVEKFARDRLRLTLKERATVLAPVLEGIPWLGFRVFPGLVRLNHASKERFVRNLRGSVAGAAEEVMADESQVARSASLCGHVAHADTVRLRRSLLQGSRHARPTTASGS
jgi:hypothetical protein